MEENNKAAALLGASAAGRRRRILRFAVTLMLMVFSARVWISGAGIRSPESAEDFSKVYQNLQDNKKQIKREIRAAVEYQDTDLSAEQVYQMELYYAGALRDGTASYIELARICSDLYTCYTNHVDLLKMTVEQIDGASSNHDVDDDAIRTARISYIALTALLIAMAAAFAGSVLMMLFGKKKRAPVLYMVLVLISLVPSVLASAAVQNPTMHMTVPVQGTVSAAAAAAAVIVWRLLSIKREPGAA